MRLADDLGIVVVNQWCTVQYFSIYDHLERVQHLLTSVAEDCMLGVLQLPSKEMSENSMRSGSVFSYHSFVDFGRFGGVHLHLKESISNGETLIREDVVEE